MLIIKKRIGIILILLNISYLSGCASTGLVKEPDILLYGDPFIKTELMFGLSKPNGTLISESDWRWFVDNHITPKFKKGLTVLDSYGQWMKQSGEVIKERSKIVVLLHKNSQDTNQHIEEIRKEYKKYFQQESVLRITTAAAVSF